VHELVGQVRSLELSAGGPQIAIIIIKRFKFIINQSLHREAPYIEFPALVESWVDYIFLQDEGPTLVEIAFRNDLFYFFDS
jgi:hypothetical protein